MSIEEGVSRMRKGMFAFASEETKMYKVIEDTFFEHEKVTFT